MSKKLVATIKENTPEETGAILKWGKLVTRITAISATLTGAFAALFSSSSIASGVVLTAAGAGTLAAAEKLPDTTYVRTKHVPPRPMSPTGRAVLGPDLLKPEKITGPTLTRPDHRMTRMATPINRTKI